MAYIEKTTFKIFQSTTSANGFECDDIIAPVIRVLNLKGYTTTFCCSGHIFDEVNEIIAINQSPEEIKNSIDNVCEIKRITRNQIDPEEYYIEDIPEDAVLYRVKFILAGNTGGAYIAFKEGCMLKTLPNGWEKDGSCIRKFFCNTYDTEYDFFEEQLESMKELKKWADELPTKRR